MVRPIQPCSGPQSTPPSPATQLAQTMQAFQVTLQQLIQKPNDPGLQLKMEPILTNLKKDLKNMQKHDPKDYNQIMAKTSFQYDMTTNPASGPVNLQNLLNSPTAQHIYEYASSLKDDPDFSTAFFNDLGNAITDFQKLR